MSSIPPPLPPPPPASMIAAAAAAAQRSQTSSSAQSSSQVVPVSLAGASDDFGSMAKGSIVFDDPTIVRKAAFRKAYTIDVRVILLNVNFVSLVQSAFTYIYVSLNLGKKT